MADLNQNKKTVSRKGRIKAVLGYGAVGLACYIIFLLISFPYGMFSTQVEAAMESALNMDVAIGEMTIKLPASAELKNVILTSRAPNNPMQQQVEPFSIKLDRVNISASPLDLIRGVKSADFKLRAFSGSAAGSFTAEDNSTVKLEITFKNIDTTKLSFFNKALGFKLAGSLSGRIDMDSNMSDASKSSGMIKLVLKAVSVREMNFQSVTVPDFEFDTFQIEIQVSDGKATIKKAQATGPKLDLQIEGHIKLQPELAKSPVSMKLIFIPTEEFKAEFPMINMLSKDAQGNPYLGVAGFLAKPQVSLPR